MSSRSSVIGPSSAGKRTTEPGSVTVPTAGRYRISGTVTLAERQCNCRGDGWVYPAIGHRPYVACSHCDAGIRYADEHPTARFCCGDPARVR